MTQELTNILKKLFQYASSSSQIKLGSLDELVIDGLDVESIWEQIQSRNRPMRRFTNKRIPQLCSTIQESFIRPETKKNTPLADDDDSSSEGSLQGDHGDDDGAGALSAEEEEMMEKWLDDVEEAEDRDEEQSSDEEPNALPDEVWLY